MKSKQMTLKNYYASLPEVVYPKTEFVEMIARECNVSLGTVRNWVLYDIKPRNSVHAWILSKYTGIPVERLWGDDAKVEKSENDVNVNA